MADELLIALILKLLKLKNIILKFKGKHLKKTLTNRKTALM